MNQQQMRSNFPIHSETLDNGLDVVIAENKKIPVICINLAYKAGSKDEQCTKTGYAHLFEHLMFEGSLNVPKGEFDKLCTMAGGLNNAYTSYDLTSYNMVLPSNQLELGLWLESDRMLQFAVSQQALDTQKKVVIEEINQTVYQQPYARWRQLLAAAAFAADCPYSWEVYGNKEHVAEATLEDIRGFFNKYYRPENACLVIAGDISAHSGIKKADKYFGHISRTNALPQRISFGSESTRSGYDSYIDAVPHAAVFVSFHLPGFLSDAVILADIVANVAGSGKSSRLYRSLVYDKQSASMAGAFADKRENASLLTFFAFASDGSVTADDLYSDLMESVLDMKKRGISKEEFNKSINQLKTSVAYSLQYSAEIADHLAKLSLFWKDTDRFYTILERFEKVSTDSLIDFIEKYVREDFAVRIDVNPEN